MKKAGILFLFLFFFNIPAVLFAQEETEKESKGKESKTQIIEFTDLKKALRSPEKVYILNLTGKQVTVIPPEIKKMVNLQTLVLAHNKIKSIPPEIAFLKKLQTLNVSYNQIEVLPAEIGELSSLVSLNLHNNLVSALPNEITKLRNLKSLSLFGNRFTSYPFLVNSLTGLQELDVAGNKVQVIPSEIRQLYQLNSLHLHYNQLISLPPEIGKLSQLNNLTLNNNQLATLPKELIQLTQLQHLNLKDNPFSILPEELYKFLQRFNYGESTQVKDLIVALTDKKEKARQELQRRKEKAELQAQLADTERERQELLSRAQMEKDEVKKKELMALAEEKESETKAKQKEIENLKELDRQKEIARQAERKIEEEQSKRQQIIIYSSIGALIVALLFVGFIYLSAQRLRKANKIIAQEKAKSEALLLNILPKEVADELKENGLTTVQYYEHTSILFADIKGFSAMATQVSPQALIKELDTCFGKFDDIISKYNLERIKTIGDCYMCAGGVPHRNLTNPVDIVLAALEIQRWMAEEKVRKETLGEKFWEIRLGIHSGDLVAGVVGKTKFAFDVWGNTVNTASRMETMGEVGKVNITEATYQQIKEFFEVEYRGKIEAKNIGQVETYFVLSIKADLSEDGLGILPNERFFALGKKKFAEKQLSQQTA